MNVFGMLAQQTGVYVQLKIHVLLPLNQCLKSLTGGTFQQGWSGLDTHFVTQMF